MIQPSSIKVDYTNSDKFKLAFVILTNYVIENKWQGACHATVAILCSIAKRLGITSTPCIGEVGCEFGIFDHSWLVIDSKVYDIAILFPLNEECSLGPVFGGIDLSNGLSPKVKYGISYSGLQEQAMFALNKNLYDYMSECDQPDLIDIAEKICSHIGFPITKKWLRDNLSMVKRTYIGMKE